MSAKQLLISLFRLHREYRCAIWDSYILKDKRTLEQVQTLACKMASKHWDAGYKELLEWVGYHYLNGGGAVWDYLCYLKSLMACVTFPSNFSLLGIFLGWIPAITSAVCMHGLMHFSSVLSFTRFLCGTYFTPNKLLGLFLSLNTLMNLLLHCS